MTHYRIHYFRDEDDNRTVVQTSLTPAGEYRARIIDGDFDISPAIGRGHSRLAAIADLQQKLEAVE